VLRITEQGKDDIGCSADSLSTIRLEASSVVAVESAAQPQKRKEANRSLPR
jgi:hypothetical protein